MSAAKISDAQRRATAVAEPCLEFMGREQHLRLRSSEVNFAAGLEFSKNLRVLDQTQTILKSLPEIVRTYAVDALLVDTVQFYAELGPMQLGTPYVHVASGLHWDYSGYTPLCVYGWPHEITPAALTRNREGVAKWTDLFQSVNGDIRAHAESVGLKIDWNDLSSTISPWASISQTPRAFDFESSHWPSQFHHTGPFHDGRGREKVDFPWERLTGEPLIYASMGTILNGRVDVFQAIVAAVAKNKNLQLVLSIGDQVDPKQISPVPNNAIIVKRAPQLELLKQASVCITHAGLNTVLESLAQGVPQLAIPITYDQPGVAARIAQKQTGLVTSLDKLTAGHLSTLLNEVLINATYRNNARKLQKAIAEANGLSVAADIVEESLLEEIKSRIEAARSGALPKSMLAKACNYTLTLWARLTRFLEHPVLELSNNLAENAMRPVALGRRNRIHIGSEDAGPRVATIVSIVETCRRLKIPVRDYLGSVLPGLGDFPINRIAELTPAAWATRN
ncbi:MAG TPA: transposase [Chthoniobacterales bacterium]|nr:transposase [Chthoniobacterales bacterium]